MKITYTAPNRSHHYPYAEALNRAGYLYSFVSGFSRLSPRSPIPSIGDKLKRHDFIQTMYLACLKYHAPYFLSSAVNRLSSMRLDHMSYKWAKDSDVFIYYRTQGLYTTRKLHHEKLPTICIMEEVNSHVDYAQNILRHEYESLGLGKYIEREPDYTRRLETYDEADYILCPSEFVRRSFLLKGFPAEKILKVNFGFPEMTHRAQRKMKSADDVIRYLYVGQIHYRKGLRYAIEAFKKIDHPKKEFIIVGPKTPVTGLEKMSIPKDVVFTGPLKGEALKYQYEQADVFILPSIEEGMALVQIEALSYGLPILITTNTGGDDLIVNGKEGFIVQPAEVNPLIERMQLFADDRLLVNEMSSAAIHTASSIGNWDATVQNLLLNLQQIMHHKKTA